MKYRVLLLMFSFFIAFDVLGGCRTAGDRLLRYTVGTLDLSRLANGDVSELRHEVTFRPAGLHCPSHFYARTYGYNDTASGYRLGKRNVWLSVSYYMLGQNNYIDSSVWHGYRHYNDLEFRFVLNFRLASGEGEYPILPAGAFPIAILSQPFRNGQTHMIATESDFFHFETQLKYKENSTTCKLSDPRPVVLPIVSISELLSNTRPGYTPFRLSFECKDLDFGRSDRGVDIYFSTNNRWHGDNTVLFDYSSGAPKGVGIRLVNQLRPEAPVAFARDIGRPFKDFATSIFRVRKGEDLNSNVSIDMAAYYHAFDKPAVTAGKINVAAAVNIVYD